MPSFVPAISHESSTAELSQLDIGDIGRLQAAGARVRSAILAGRLPDELADAIGKGYRRLDEQYGANCDVAAPSSATAEDLPEPSFAGQQETLLNIHGEVMLLDEVKRCFASLFTGRAIVYRVHHGFDHGQVALSVGVQKMVRSDLACAGVMFSIDTETGFSNAVLISAAYGESVVQGTVKPYEFYVFKPTLAKSFRPILQKKLGTKEFRLVYEEGGTRQTRSVPVPKDDRERFVLSDDEILRLAGWAVEVEAHYARLRGAPSPMDIEWARDGRSGELFLVQARRETVHARRDPLVLERMQLEARGAVVATGRSAGEKIGQGAARIIRSAADLEQLQQGEVLVTEMTDPDWEPVMKRAAAVVTDRGGHTCHAAIVSKELGIPAIVGTGSGTSAIPAGQDVTVSCAEGEDGSPMKRNTMNSSAHELVLDLEPAVSTEDRRLYGATVVARAARDGHWNAWLEFVAHGSQEVLRTGIETHQASEADLHRWATTLSDVYLRGALDRALVSPAETVAHRRAVATAASRERGGAAAALDPFELFALGEHVLQRELQMFRRPTLLALIINHDLNPLALDLSRFTKAQLVAFIVTAVEVRPAKTAKARRRKKPHNVRARQALAVVRASTSRRRHD